MDSRPKIVKHLAEAGLIDKVAMDIKACPDNYAKSDRNRKA